MEQNFRNLGYRRKKLQSGLECFEATTSLQLNLLFRGFELHHIHLESLKAAWDCQAAIQLHHLQLRIDLSNAQSTGTLKTLKQMLQTELSLSTQDKSQLEQDRIHAFETKYKEDTE